MSRVTKTALIVSAFAVYIALIVVSLICDSFLTDVILHTYSRLLACPLAVKIFKMCLNNQLQENTTKAMILCGCFFAVDLVIIDAIRFAVSGGVGTVLFIPACLPLIFIVVMYYSLKNSDRFREDFRTALFIGIPLLLISLYFEIISFIQI